MSQDRLAWFRSKRTWIGVILALLLVSFAFQATFAEVAVQPEQPLNIRLPRLVFHLNESGAVQTLGVMTAPDTEVTIEEPQLDFLSSILGLNLRMQLIDPATMNALSEANVQHIQIQTASEGIALYGNGQFLLGVAWGAQETLQQVAQLAEAADVQFARPVARLVPAIGADLLVDLPAPSDAEPVSPREVGTGLEFPSRQAPAGEPPIVLHATGEYTADGTPMVLDTSLVELGNVLGANLGVLRLNETALGALQDAGIARMGVTLDYQGASVLVDDNPVATVVLGPAESIELAIRLAQRFEVPYTELMPLAGQTQNLDIQVTVDLP